MLEIVDNGVNLLEEALARQPKRMSFLCQAVTLNLIMLGNEVCFSFCKCVFTVLPTDLLAF